MMFGTRALYAIAMWGRANMIDAACRPPSILQSLWDSINAKRGYLWESNPWVWAITFERCN